MKKDLLETVELAEEIDEVIFLITSFAQYKPLRQSLAQCQTCTNSGKSKAAKIVISNI